MTKIYSFICNMPPKANAPKSVTVVRSEASKHGSLEGTEETEIHAQVHVPEEGCWGWVVVAAAFTIISVLDGVAYTFGSIRPDMSLDLGVSDTLVALINSIAVALYLLAGPLVSALINRFGFRACTMTGSVICSLSIFTSYFLHSYGALCLFYGVLVGLGYSLINMSAGLVVGFYFEKLRSLAIAISTVGSSVGVTTWYPINTYLVQLAGWRSVILLHSGMFGTLFFIAMAFRPLLALHVVQTQVTQDPTRTVTYLPNVAASPQEARNDTAKPTAAERLFAAVKNDHFPTAHAVVHTDDQPAALSNQPGPSAAPVGVSKLTITAMTPKTGISQRHLQQVKSMISKTSVSGDAKQQKLQIDIPEQETKKVSCWGRLCHWEQHVPESRPMYRDDAFYDGKIEQLPVYQKSRAAVTVDQETGLEYQLAVSRAAAAQDLQEHRGVFTTAVRRILATMMDPKLLKLRTFQLMCASGFLIYLGLLVPYSYIQDRNLQAGVAAHHCSLFVSAIGGFNAAGRLILGSLAAKFDPVKISATSSCVAGLATVFSSVSLHEVFQFVYCGIYGFCISNVASLRALVLVKLYGLEKLTNATGMILLFQGLGSLISTPLAGILKEKFGYTVAFSVAGLFITFGGLILVPVNYLSLKEKDPPVSSKDKTPLQPAPKKPQGSKKPATSKK